MNLKTDLIEKLHEQLVPSAGMAETVEGELVRAVSRVGYRYYNDGDLFWDGYGCETAGPSATYLQSMTEVPGLVEAVKLAECSRGNYEVALQQMVDSVVAYVESKQGNYTKNEVDSRDFESNWVEEPDEDEDDDEDEDWNN